MFKKNGYKLSILNDEIENTVIKSGHIINDKESLIAKTLQELRNFCGSSNNKNKVIKADFPWSILEEQEDWKSDWAAMCHFAKLHGAKSIDFTDYSHEVA